MRTYTTLPLYIELLAIHLASLVIYWIRMDDYTWIRVFRSYRAIAVGFQVQGFLLGTYLQDDPKKLTMFLILSIYYVLPSFSFLVMCDYHFSNHLEPRRDNFSVTESLIRQEFIRFWSSPKRSQETREVSQLRWEDHMDAFTNRMMLARNNANVR